jgi:hypothetical protein
VLFVPRRVTTHARIPELEAAEAALHVEALVDKGLANTTVVDVRA